MEQFTPSARQAFSLLFDAAPDAMLLVDGAGVIVMANAHAARLFGFGPGELVGQPVEIVVPERYRRTHLQHRGSYFRTPSVRPMGAGLELFGLRRDGSEFPVEISLSPVETEAGAMAISAIRDITDRKRADEERVKLAREQAARAEAEAANRMKDEFLAMLAHELRNPLSAVQTGLGVLDRIGGREPVAASTRDVMNRQIRHLSRMVDDLLDVSRVSTGKIVLHRQPVDVPELIARCVASVTRADAGDHEITTRTQPVVVDADPLRLEQIVTNLLTNATKYTPAGGAITITASRTEGTATIVVEDTGVGMTPDLVERVFDLFVQGERSLARSEGGLGIGLTLVRRLTEMHGGSIEAASDGPGRGSRFTVRLPAVAVSRTDRHRRTMPSITVTVAPSGRRVLLVEDNGDVREMLRTLLQLDGHEVHEAVDGPTGLQAALELRPDIAFVDIGLPGMNGYELIGELRARIDGTPPVLIALTGYGRAEDRQRIEQAGFDACLIKPVEPARIADVMARVRRLP